MRIDKIHEDHRGSIHSVTESPLKYPEVSFLETKAGLARGGCIHRVNWEHLVVIQGEIIYVLEPPLQDWSTDHHIDINEKGQYEIKLKVGQSISIPPNTAHFIISITDSIISEWGCEISEKAEKHEALRKIVLDHNDGLTNSK